MGLLGEYLVKMDVKSRIKLPAGLKGQLQPEEKGSFVINRGFEPCLVLYPKSEWLKITARVDQLNTFKKKNREFVRLFYRGATEIQLDSADRLLLPRALMPYANIKGEVLMTANRNIIEIWNKEKYDELMSADADAFADLAEEVMGDLDINEDE